MKILKAKSSDIDSVLELIQSASSWLELNGIKQWTRFPREILEQEVSSSALYVVKEAESIIGSVVVSFEKRSYWDDRNALYIDRIVIDRRYAGQGISDKILLFLQSMAREAEVGLLRFNCAADNEKLCSYYRNRGCKAVGT